jgi:membrane associated rhomboid family serine protease
LFPLKDTIRSRTFPIVNTIIIAVNLLAFLFEFSLGRQMDVFIRNFGLTPVRFYWGLHHDLADAVIPIFTSMFLHGGWLHVLGNMWFLYIFGDNVEDRVGHFGYLIFYLTCGVGAALSQTLFFPGSSVPMVGASGAIAGVLGAYFMLYPNARILSIIPIFFFIQLMEVPAVVFLVFWFFLQFIQGALTPATQGGGVAWWAHVGGFLFGLVLIWFFKKPEPKRPTWQY